MSRGRCAAVTWALVVPWLLAPSLATAQSTLLLGGTPVLVRTIPVRLTGQLTVAFHGDAASGCASRGLCGYAGTVSWQPPTRGAVEINTYRERRHLEHELYFVPDYRAGYQAASGGVTTATVQLSSSPLIPPGVDASCLDAVDTSSPLSLPVRRGRVAFTLAGASSSLLATRCAGPLDADVIPALPAPMLALGAVAQGRTVVALNVSRGFASHGFAGTVQSTVSITLGRPRRAARTHPGHPLPGLRQIRVLYRATLAGSVVERVRGSSDPAICAALGSCGLAGTVTLTPRAAHISASIAAAAPGRRPLRDLLTAVGLSTRGRAAGILTFGSAAWHGGRVEATLTRSTSCRDSAPLGSGAITLAVGRGHFRASYEPGFGTVTARTRCPGPIDAAARFLATGAAPIGRPTRRTIRISLTTGSTFVDDGYGVRTVPHLTLTLTRVGVRAGASLGASGVIAVGSSGGGFVGP